MKTFVMKPKDQQRKWYLVDAKDLVLGRLAVDLSNIIRGKNKEYFSPHMDCGDYVVVINADKVRLTGNKYLDKKYYYHTGYVGGIVERNPKQIFEGKNPEKVLFKAVERMMTRNSLSAKVLSKLKIYAGDKHPHEAQNPQLINVADMHVKISRGN